MNTLQKFLAVESIIVIAILLYLGDLVHAAIHLLITVYLVNHLKNVNTDFTKKG